VAVTFADSLLRTEVHKVDRRSAKCAALAAVALVAATLMVLSVSV